MVVMILMMIKDDENDNNNDNNKNNQEAQCLLKAFTCTRYLVIRNTSTYIFQNGRCQDLPRGRGFPEAEQPGEMSLEHRHQSVPEDKQSVEAPETFSVFLPASLRTLLRFATV